MGEDWMVAYSRRMDEESMGLHWAGKLSDLAEWVADVAARWGPDAEICLEGTYDGNGTILAKAPGARAREQQAAQEYSDRIRGKQERRSRA